MLDLMYSLVIEATEEPDFFTFFSPNLQGFTGVGHSIEGCIHQAKLGMVEHLSVLGEAGLPIPPSNQNPTVVVRNAQPMSQAA